jgi:hypothetical protein
MDQITGNPRDHDEGVGILGWKFAHQRLSQLLLERVEPIGALIPILKLDAAGTMYQRLYVPRDISKCQRRLIEENPPDRLESRPVLLCSSTTAGSLAHEDIHHLWPSDR